MTPRATYRLQFHKGFTFADAAPLAPYLARLGVSHVYASPIGTARAGSTHGYDQVDPTRINPELGGEEGFLALVAALKAQGLGVILDIVPNHMAVGQADNLWWLDVLEHGADSPHAQLFDIDWIPADPALMGKVLTPFLGAPYAEALAAGDLKLKRDPATGRCAVWAYDAHCFPLRPEDQPAVSSDRDFATRFYGRDPQGRARLHDLLERQHFRLAWWRTAGDEINWRRFFDITELAGLRVERPEVFDLVHALPLRLYAEGLIDGVRVDHVDGLADPAAYCRRLRSALTEAGAKRPPGASGGRAYFVVEKILAQGERLSPDWLTDGTTGYDYMNEAAALLHDADGEAELTRLWIEVSGRSGVFEDEERQARLETLRRSFSGQLEAAVRAFHRVARSDVATRDLTAGMLRRGLTVLLSVFPVYRTYATGEAAPASDGPVLQHALARAQAFVAPGEGPVLDRIAAWLSGEGPGDGELRREAARRFQQLSAPVSAKAVEDTAFYRYGRLLSRDDVGSDPARLAGSVEHMHAANLERAASFPHALLATATHDHKRGEDVRARLAVLSEAPQRWGAAVRRWSEMNAGLAAAIDPLDTYPLYQTLVGAWPLTLGPDDAAGLAAFCERVGGWWRKALREAKLHSSWAAPDEAYEAACLAFLKAALDPALSSGFLLDLVGFVDDVAPAGAVNGLVQALLRCTAPGVPDLYQGTEGWDLSLVDPDNRRQVDYAERQAALESDKPWAELLSSWPDGRVKQRLIATALGLRRRWPEVFAKGDYRPIDVQGAETQRVIAFARQSGPRAVIVFAPLHLQGAVDPRTLKLLAGGLGGGSLILPADLQHTSALESVSGRMFDLSSPIKLTDLFHSAPFALLELS
ncbi:malto-oligosyltrehalose synthase [Caulobacter sp. S45]|uniref:malto-oligosyltrehalose synthase n=1 Tax=Caulobacter sp. S45 TaxID=1641861 RepID=UPI001576E762|nr:malto-oligosyltrehalose synthase [Caulobacter sp. S45]